MNTGLGMKAQDDKRKTGDGARPKINQAPLSEKTESRQITLRNISISQLDSMWSNRRRFGESEVDAVVSTHGNYMNTYKKDMYPYICAGAKGKHVYLVPIDGRRKGEVLKVFDAFNFYGVGAGVGHANEDIISAAVSRMEKGALVSASFFEPSRAELCDYLFNPASGLFSGILPGYSLYLLNSGSESNDAAMKLACEFHRANGEAGKRNVVIAMENGFHGRTGYASNINMKPYVIEGFPQMKMTVLFAKFGSIAQLEVLFRQNRGSIHSVFFEPIQGESGVIVPTTGYVKKMRALCDAEGAVMVADEVQTFARTGAWFASIDWGATPDIIVAGKIASGGIAPVSAIFAKPGIAFGEHRHGNTYTGNPLACELLMSTLQHIEENNLLENSAIIGEYLMGKLRQRLGGAPGIKEIRGKGSMVAVELAGEARKNAWGVVLDCVENELLLGLSGTGTLRMLLPLALTRKEADGIVEMLEIVLSATE